MTTIEPVVPQASAAPVIFRRFALPLDTFAYLKEYQRKHTKENLGETLNNNEMLVIILREHQQHLKQQQHEHKSINQVNTQSEEQQYDNTELAGREG